MNNPPKLSTKHLDEAARAMVPKDVSKEVTQKSVNIDIRDQKPRTDLRVAFALERTGGLWNVATLYYQDDQIVKIDRTEPNIKAIAVNELKMANAKHWMNLG